MSLFIFKATVSSTVNLSTFSQRNVQTIIKRVFNRNIECIFVIKLRTFLRLQILVVVFIESLTNKTESRVQNLLYMFWNVDTFEINTPVVDDG